MIDRLVSFSCLCLGAKFKYADPGIDRVWVKIGHNEIAAWDESQLDTDWVGQQICCFADNDDKASLAVEVELVEEKVKP